MSWAPLTSFVSSLGRHTPKSLGKDLNVNSFCKNLKNNKLDGALKFSKANEFLSNLNDLSRGIGVLKDIHSGLIDNGYEGASNGEHGSIPFTSKSEDSSLGKNDARYYKTHIHVGKPSHGRIKNIQSGAFVETIERLTCSSSEDYLNHKDRNKLNFKCGFNEKGFAFLMEDTYFSIKDFYDLFRIKKNYQKELESNDDGKKDIYGCVLNTKHKFKLKNRMEYFTGHIKIHLIKILDLETDVRELIEEITHNSKTESVDKSGKIPVNQQYSDPDLSTKENKLSIDFVSSLNCNLKLSTRFKERAKIVKSWSRTLGPGSIWEFNLTHHYGRGIHLNKIYDIEKRKEKSKDPNQLDIIFDTLTETKNQTSVKKIKEMIAENLPKSKKKTSEHPVGYVFCLEFVGDRRASIVNKQNDYFSGYSPCHFSMEFDTKIKFLTNDQDEEDLLVYKRNRQDKNFNEDSEFPDIFYPDRQPSFHVSFDEISNKKSYKMVYDQGIKSSTDFSSVIEILGEKLTEYGLNLGSINPEDAAFNYFKEPDEDEDKEYEGTGGPPPV